MKFLAIAFAALLVCFLPAACVSGSLCQGIDLQGIDLQELGTTLGTLPLIFGVVAAKCSEATAKQIRSEKSPKKLRERVEVINKEVQKHREMINADTYEWRQEDEDKMHALFDERQLCIQRAEFTETVDDVLGQITRSHDTNPRGEDVDLRDDDPGDRRDRKKRTDGPLTPEERDNALNFGLARFLGVNLSDDNQRLVQRGNKAGVFAAKRNEIQLPIGRMSPEFKQLQRQLRAGHDLSKMDTRDLTVNTGVSSAGLFGAAGFIPQLERVMLYFGPMLQVCTVLQTKDGRDLTMPTVDDTGNTGDVVGESAAVTLTQDPTISNQTWKSVKIRSKMVKYAAEAEEDSVFDLFSLLVDLMGERVARGANSVWTLGSATDVQGAVPGAAAGVTTTALGLATDDTLAQKIVALYYSVDVAYRNNAGCFMCNDTHLARFATLKHSDGTWMYRMKDGMSDTLWGRPVKPNNHMVATLAATDRPLLYGDFSKYWIRLVNNVRIRKFAELYGGNDQDAVQLFRRVGGRYATVGAVKAMVLT